MFCNYKPYNWNIFPTLANSIKSVHTSNTIVAKAFAVIEYWILKENETPTLPGSLFRSECHIQNMVHKYGSLLSLIQKNHDRVNEKNMNYSEWKLLISYEECI